MLLPIMLALWAVLLSLPLHSAFLFLLGSTVLAVCAVRAFRICFPR